MKKRFIFECDDYVEWEVEEMIWLNPDGSYTPSYPNNIHILESRVNEGNDFIFLKYHWTQMKLKNNDFFSQKNRQFLHQTYAYFLLVNVSNTD